MNIELINLLLLGFILILSCMLVIVMVMLRNLLKRYEKFRLEAAELMHNAFENIVDINARLTAAGYPPGRVLPAAAYPGWTPPPASER